MSKKSREPIVLQFTAAVVRINSATGKVFQVEYFDKQHGNVPGSTIIIRRSDNVFELNYLGVIPYNVAQVISDQNSQSYPDSKTIIGSFDEILNYVPRSFEPAIRSIFSFVDLHTDLERSHGKIYKCFKPPEVPAPTKKTT